MELEPIKEIEQLIKSHVDLTKKDLVDGKIFRLTKPGENYGSLMLGVDLVLRNKSDRKEETVKCVAKMLPPNEMLREYFCTDVTFRSEIEFYKNIVPTVQQFQREQGVEETKIFPACMGARCNLQDDDERKIDGDAVVLLENLKILGYQTSDCSISFDLETSLLIVAELAKFHATTLALKVEKPNLFEKKIRKYAGGFKYNPENVPHIVEGWKEIIEKDNELAPLASRIIKTLNLPRQRTIREPYATLIHNDFWVNNIMIKLDNGQPSSVKMVDFAVYEYGSPFWDLLFFLFSSVQLDIVSKNYDNLIENYHREFTNTLKELKCTSMILSLDEMLKEIDIEAETEFFHVAFMVFPIFADKTKVPDLSTLSKKQLLLGDSTNDLQRQRANFYAKQFAQRNWLCE